MPIRDEVLLLEAERFISIWDLLIFFQDYLASCYIFNEGVLIWVLLEIIHWYFI